MNRTFLPPTLMLIPLTLLAFATAASQAIDTVRIDPRAGSRVWIEGESNVHDWACRASSFEAHVELDARPANGEDADAPADLIRRVTVRLSARDLKCGNSKMESDLYSALKATDPTKPSYIVARFDAVPGSQHGSTLDTEGTLAIAGIERDVKVRISTEGAPDGAIRARGSAQLLMTDFGVKPPVGLFGLIRARNTVTVKFDLVIKARGVITAAGR